MATYQTYGLGAAPNAVPAAAPPPGSPTALPRTWSLLNGAAAMVRDAQTALLRPSVPVTNQSTSGYGSTSPNAASGGAAPPVPGGGANAARGPLIIAAKIVPALAAVYFLVKGQHGYAAAAGAAAVGAFILL